METLKAKNHDASNIVDALAGEEKMARIQETILESVKHMMLKEKCKNSVIVERLCNLYCDTPAEIAGLSIYIIRCIDVITEKVEQSPLDKLFRTMFGTLIPKYKIKELPDEILRTLLEEHEDCNPDLCDIKREAVRRGLI